MRRTTIVLLCLLGGCVAPAMGQLRFLIADRTNNRLYRVQDINLNGVIDEPGEVFVFFDNTNAAGTPGFANLTALGVSPTGVVIVGDQINRNIYRLQDRNDDGDAQDVGESAVYADATNAAGVSLAFPTGIGFDGAERTYVVNTGNSFGFDGVYRLVDLNEDGDAQDAGEIVPVVENFGVPPAPGNGAFNPQELAFVGNVGYIRNSSAGSQGIFRFEDLNASGRADDAGEFTPFFTSANLSGISLSAGFAIGVDRARPAAMYMLHTAPGAVDQLIRASDLDQNGNANGANEARIVWSTAEAGFTGVDLFCLPTGDVLITDNANTTTHKVVIRLHDANGDGLFAGAGERTEFFPNAVPSIGDIRQIEYLPLIGDTNCDGAVNNFDIDAFVIAILGSAEYYGRYPECNRGNADANHDGRVNNFDIDAFVQLILHG